MESDKRKDKPFHDQDEPSAEPTDDNAADGDLEDTACRSPIEPRPKAKGRLADVRPRDEGKDGGKSS